jgi:hypothetical protein
MITLAMVDRGRGNEEAILTATHRLEAIAPPGYPPRSAARQLGVAATVLKQTHCELGRLVRCE